MPYLASNFAARVDIGESASDVEEWSRIVEEQHVSTVDLAARRLVSAISRPDRSDALIDAIIVWENLLGTKRKVSANVTRAIAQMLEDDPSRQLTLEASLRNVYDVRSRVVHGNLVEQGTVTAACRDAIDAAVRVLRVCYRKGSEWLKLDSTQRANAVLREAVTRPKSRPRA
ncbi:MAG: hypothetical protein ACRD3G_22255 [Vicinamibacterales bacterium]